MSDQVPLERRFHEGLCLAASGEPERARTAFLECVTADPSCGEFVHELLTMLAGGARAIATAGAPSSGEEDAVQRAAAQGNWAEVLRAGPQRLAHEGWHVPTLLVLAEACAAQGYGESEAHYLRAALNTAGDAADIQRRAGRALARLQRFEEALSCWRRLESIEPSDEEAPRMIATLTIAASRRRAGLHEADDRGARRRLEPSKRRRTPFTRFVIANSQTLFASGQATAGLSLTPIQQLEAAIRERPSIAELYLRLAQLYLDKDRDYDAERLLAKGREATDHDARVQQMWEDVTMLRHQRRLKMAEQEVKAADHPAARDALKQAIKDRDRVELEIFAARCKREPDNAASQYELGLRLARGDKLREAGKHLEKALAASEQRGPAALALAQCLEKVGEIPQALHYYRLAAEAGAAADQLEERSEALYRAGKLAVRMKLAKLAQRYLAQLLRLDPNHREAALLMQCT